VPYVKFSDFESDALKAFRRKAIESARLTSKDLEIPDEILLHNLHLTSGDYLTRAAILFFHQDPENWILGAYIKIGFFENAADILYQDEIHGPLITMADKAEDLVYTKYFKGIISYAGLQRIENFPIPRQAFREAVLNAVIHRDYSTGNPIHIHIYPDKVLIYNDGKLPENWTVEKLLSTHTSVPYNPLIASAFFSSGQIEAWGRGVEKITNACKSWGKPEPFYEAQSNSIMIGFDTDVDLIGNFVENETQRKIIEMMITNPKVSRDFIAAQIGITTRSVQKSINALKEVGVVERVGAAKGGHWAVKTKRFTKKIPEKFAEKIPEKFTRNETQRKIIEMMLANPKVSIDSIAAEIGITTRGVQKSVNALKELGLIERVGAAKGGHWVVKTKKFTEKHP
jgi:ATP-dependent DNA helicase RecG